MSLPAFSTQAELFSTAGLSASLFAPTDRYGLFAKVVYPALGAARDALGKCYCLDNGRTAIEPVLMLGVSILQELDGVPDRQALEPTFRRSQRGSLEFFLGGRAEESHGGRSAGRADSGLSELGLSIHLIHWDRERGTSSKSSN